MPLLYKIPAFAGMTVVVYWDSSRLPAGTSLRSFRMTTLFVTGLTCHKVKV